ncbi:MAG: restriction endonuclease [Dehalococcoidia bacterium]|nr:restriction endonuclease [Dehalococcoidia bacterium]MDH4367090.1 restriction endonuclease [Dehalococcoidia bacterium]
MVKKKTSSKKASLDKQKRGYKAAVTGQTFEKKIGEFLSSRGYRISYEKLVGRARFDVFGKRKEDWEREEYCIAECKDRNRVTSADVMRFMSKLRTFYARLPVDFDGDKPYVQGLFAYTGEVSADARNAAKGFKPSIKFKKF